MSNYHRIRCDTCDEQSPTETLNRGGGGLRMALERLDVLLPLTALEWPLEVEVRCHGHWINLHWLRAHSGHVLSVWDEYGEKVFTREPPT